MIKVVCIDETEGGQNGLNLLTNGKVYDAYTAEDFNNLHTVFPEQPEDSYYIIGDDGYPIMPLRIYFKPLREYNIDNLI